MATRQIWSDEEFMRWCEALKPCKYCGEKFVGPVCGCERLGGDAAARVAPGKARRSKR